MLDIWDMPENFCDFRKMYKVSERMLLIYSEHFSSCRVSSLTHCCIVMLSSFLNEKRISLLFL